MIIAIHSPQTAPNFAIWTASPRTGSKAFAENKHTSQTSVARQMPNRAVAASCVLSISPLVDCNRLEMGRDGKRTYPLWWIPHDTKQRKGRKAIAPHMRAWTIHIGTKLTRCHRGLRCSRPVMFRDGILTTGIEMNDIEAVRFGSLALISRSVGCCLDKVGLWDFRLRAQPSHHG
jgi:hypothetical protein